jgi:hypothetical protein
MKKKSAAMRKLREDLHYWQMIARIEARVLRATREKVKEVAAKMRSVQKGKVSTFILSIVAYIIPPITKMFAGMA